MPSIEISSQNGRFSKMVKTELLLYGHRLFSNVNFEDHKAVEDFLKASQENPEDLLSLTSDGKGEIETFYFRGKDVRSLTVKASN
jgi:hypothetical protein